MANRDTGENGKVNKSQAIRDFYAENPKADSKTVVAGLAERGVKVSPRWSITSRASWARPSGRPSESKWPSRRGRQRLVNPVEIILRVKDHLAREVGGVKNLKQLVDLLAE